MVKHQTPACRNQAGFTLVELAIVMIIIGLLIAGVLKGQALISNAQVTSTVAQIKAIDAATTTFSDQYSDVPGDMSAANSAARLPNCTTAPCNTGGDGDGKVDAAGVSITFGGVPNGEQLSYWAQLNAAGLLTGIAPTAANGTTSWGLDRPASKISGGGFDVGWNQGGAANALSNVQMAGALASGVTSGTYLALHGIANGGVTATAPDAFLTPLRASQIDTKIDDGVPGTGTVLAAGAGTCAAAGAYTTSGQSAACSLYIEFHN